MNQTTTWTPTLRSRLKRGSLLGAALALVCLGSGCATVKPWERETHALRQMEVNDLACHRFERNMEVYREGAVGANGGKSGGGCGCS